jgi:arylsulfatase A-like enzyme
VVIDTLRADRLGAHGYGLPTSPAIDELTADGILFERAVASSSSTAPSHASIMTGLAVREHSIGHFNGRTRLEGERTLAQHFREAGWATAAFVGNYLLQERTGFNAGFDVFDSQLASFVRDDITIFERRAKATVERAIEWMEEPRHTPFFLWVHLQDPHAPYAAPERYSQGFQIEPRPGEPHLPHLNDRFGYRGIPAVVKVNGLTRPSQYESLYAAEVAFADAWVGRLVDALDNHPSGRKNVVLLTADHGESMGEYDYWFVHSHTTTPDLAHVPFVLRAPGLPAERRRDLVSHVDIMPTLLELAGLDVPDGLRGIPLAPWLRRNQALPERVVICDMGLELSAYMGNRFTRLVNVGPVSLDPSEIPETADRGEPPLPARGGHFGSIEPRWWSYTWEGDGSYVHAPGEASLDPRVREYLSKPAKSPTFNEPMSPEELRRLRALGYW